MCIEKSLFALSSFRVCPLSQVKYLSSISEYKSSVLETCEGYRSRAPFLMECAVSSKSKDSMSVYEGRRVVSSSAGHSWCCPEDFRRGGNSGLKNEGRQIRPKALNTLVGGAGGGGVGLGMNTEQTRGSNLKIWEGPELLGDSP